MPAYSQEELYNKYVHEQSSQAFLNESISEEAYRNILLVHPLKLYTPNNFIRIALAVLTLVAIIFSGLLLALMLNSFSSGGIGLLLFYSIICYVALELVIKEKHYYNAGIDNLLLFFSAAFLVSALCIPTYANQEIIVSGVMMVACLLLAIRFTDAFMAVLSYMALLVFIFLVYTKLGNIAKATAPFLLMAVSIIVYSVFKKLAGSEKLWFYRHCFKSVLLFTMLTLYVSGNYYVIKELSNQMFDLHLDLHATIPFGWLFWFFTFAIPCAYIAFGIKKKELVFIRTGLVLLAVSVFTYRYYYAIAPPEIAMLVSGALLIIISYAIIKFLKKPAYGFCMDKHITANKERIDIKSLIITQVTGKKTSADSGVQFGGGSFGGGGAEGNY